MLEKLLDVEPPRVRLANLPTRGHWLRYAVEGTKIWVKRDDHTGTPGARGVRPLVLGFERHGGPP